MIVRLGALAAVLSVLLAAFALPAAFDDAPATVARDSGASRRSAAANEIGRLEQVVRNRPDHADAHVRLASLYLVRARETGDPAFYTLADAAADRALERRPDDVPALVTAAGVALARHDFTGALAIGLRARALDADVAAVHGVLTDAYVELGRYDEAAAAAQEMLDRRPDFPALIRASYLRELHGDVEGAIAAAEQAAPSAATPFDCAFAAVIIGNLQIVRGDLDAAQAAYERAARLLPDDAMVQAALARVAIARGDAAGTEQLLRDAVMRRPLPEYAITLGDLLAAQGDVMGAQEQYALVRVTQQLLAANGVETDLELALFEADHGDAEAAYALARAAYARRPGIYGADALARAAFRSGRIEEARRYAPEALRLGTRDPRLAYHAGEIARASGDADGARRQLERAVAASAALSPLEARAAASALDDTLRTAAKAAEE